VIDGVITDWDSVINTCGVGGMPMYEAGSVDKDEVSNAYTNYDCLSNELCILVLVNTTATDKDGNRFVLDNDEAQMWFKVYDINNSVQPPNSKQVINNTIGETIGWEGCYTLGPGDSDPAGCWTNVEIHANFCTVQGDVVGECEKTTSTGKGGQDNGIGIFLKCCSS
jgi:hypothetical protein